MRQPGQTGKLQYSCEQLCCCSCACVEPIPRPLVERHRSENRTGSTAKRCRLRAQQHRSRARVSMATYLKHMFYLFLLLARFPVWPYHKAMSYVSDHKRAGRAKKRRERDGRSDRIGWRVLRGRTKRRARRVSHGFPVPDASFLVLESEQQQQRRKRFARKYQNILSLQPLRLRSHRSPDRFAGTKDTPVHTATSIFSLRPRLPHRSHLIAYVWRRVMVRPDREASERASGRASERAGERASDMRQPVQPGKLQYSCERLCCCSCACVEPVPRPRVERHRSENRAGFTAKRYRLRTQQHRSRARVSMATYLTEHMFYLFLLLARSLPSLAVP
jgi:hypothetical protein